MSRHAKITNPLIISDKLELLPKDSWSKNESFRQLVICKFKDTQEKQLTRLTDVLPELPSGIVFKDETGMGATTLELKSKRNSIIVEPIKITASSKAFEHKFLYVGSPTKYHPDKVAHLGEDVQKAANAKFQELNAAYEKIKKERGIV